MHGGGIDSLRRFFLLALCAEKRRGMMRKNAMVGCCGLSCGICPMQMGRYCPGCGQGAGNQPCAKVKCGTVQRGVAYCVACTQYPCEKYSDFDRWDSFITHQNREQNLFRLAEMGEMAYTAEIQEKRKLLETLLTDCNGGRKKTFYFLAVHLLPLAAVQDILSQAKCRQDWGTLSKKERESLLVPLFAAEAERRGIELRLRKKV